MLENKTKSSNILHQSIKLYHLANIKLRKEPYKYIFILGHMRSGSSLLVHILNTNPDICGYGEAHNSYRTDRDLNQLIYKNKLQLKPFKTNDKYILDKILHNNHEISEQILKNKNIYFIFLYRHPQQSLSSMINLYRGHRSIEEKKASLDYYLNYYTNRLNKLKEYASLINDKNRSLAFSYTELIEDTDCVFVKLKKFLSLESNFQENYQLLKTTGIKGIGDISDRIKSGKIVRNINSPTDNIPAEIINSAEKEYVQYVDCLQQYCS